MNINTWENGLITIRVDYDACSGHGDCVESCPSEVYDLVDGHAVPSRIGDCVECCTCVSVCPETAIDHSSCN